LAAGPVIGYDTIDRWPSRTAGNLARIFLFLRAETPSDAGRDARGPRRLTHHTHSAGCRCSTIEETPVQLTHLKFEISDQVATITLNRPEARNALSPEMRRDLDAVLAVIKEKAGEEIKAAILTGAGNAFSAGGDVKGMRTRQETPADTRNRMREA